MEERWFTLAVSNIGTHKMQFRDEMNKDDAIKLGKKYCEESNLAYAGTFYYWEVNEKERVLRKIIYEKSKKEIKNVSKQIEEKHCITKKENVVLLEIPKKSSFFGNKVKIIMPEEYIDYNLGTIDINEFIKNVYKTEIEFEYEPQEREEYLCCKK